MGEMFCPTDGELRGFCRSRHHAEGSWLIVVAGICLESILADRSALARRDIRWLDLRRRFKEIV